MEGPAEFVVLSEGIGEAMDAVRIARDGSSALQSRLNERMQQLATILRLTREVAGYASLRYVARSIIGAAGSLADFDRVVLWTVDEGGAWLCAVADSAGDDLEPVGLADIELAEAGVSIGPNLTGRAVRSAAGESMAAPERVPLIAGQRVVGVLELLPSPGGRRCSPDILVVLAAHAATSLEAARLYEQSSQLSVTDALTGLANRRRFDADLAVEVARSMRYQRPLGFMMIDADHFKSYNDQFGHQRGDDALRELASVLARSVRTSDTVYRYGGEEFAVILRETASDAAHHLGVRLCDVVAHHFVDPAWARSITVSVGTAAIPADAFNGSSLVAAADRALYVAKATGRARAVPAPSRPPLIDLGGDSGLSSAAEGGSVRLDRAN
jgi:diguanylate cyclase (GGDEF)-like protein